MQFFQHDAGEREAQAMYDCVMNGDLTTGRVTQEFIYKLQCRFNFGEIAVTNSGTSALFLALKASGIGPGDEVITTPYVGVWTSNPILMVGARPVYADIDPITYALDPDSVKSMVGPKTKAVMPVSVNGVPFNYARMRELLPTSIQIIGDDIEALGSKRGSDYVGTDLHGQDLSVNGFWVSKQVTTCSGGMVTGPDSGLVQTIARLTRHGHGVQGDMWNQAFGYNLWLPDPLAAMGIVQIERFEEKQLRLKNVEQMIDSTGLGAFRQQHCRGQDHRTRFVYLITLPMGVAKVDYTNAMLARGVPTRPYFNSLTDVPHLSMFAKNCPIALQTSKHTIALPFHWKIKQEDAWEMYDAHMGSLKELGAIL